MIANLKTFTICPNCGSPEHLNNYPAKGQKLCTKCGHECIELQLKNVEKLDEILDDCPFCGTEGEEDDTLYENEDILIFKCKKCGKLDGYKFPYIQTDADIYDFDFEGEYDPLSVKEAENEKNYIFPAWKYKALAKALHEKERDPKEKCKRKLDLLIYQARPKMEQYGVAYETINRVKWKLQNFIEARGPFTEKQLRSQLAGALSMMQDELIETGRFYGKRVTERQIKEIFNVDRKTIRKWKHIFLEQRKYTWLRILTHLNGNQEHAMVKFPMEVKSIVSIEPPYEGNCDLCLKTTLLYWRIIFNKGSWSDICEKTFASLIHQSFEHKWELEKRIIRR